MSIKKIIRKVRESIIFSSPQKANLVVFDRVSVSGLECVVKNFSYAILDTRNETFYFSFRLMVRALMNLKYLSTSFGHYNVKGIYLLSCLQVMKPKVVLTFVDNSSHFHWLSRIFKTVDFYAVENGIRPLGCTGKVGVESIRTTEKISFTNYICYGNYEAEHFCAQGHEIDCYYPFGPVPQSYYKKNISPGIDKNIQYQVCKIAQGNWSVFEEYPDYPERFKKLIITLDNYMARYIQECGISACLPLRYDKDDFMMNYYHKVYGDCITYVKFEQFISTYVAIEQSEVVVNSFSSVGPQALGWGKKVLFADFSGTPCHNFFASSVTRFPEVEELCVVTEDSYEAFAKKLSRLINMPYEEYFSIVKEAMSYYGDYDDEYPAYQKTIDLIKLKL